MKQMNTQELKATPVADPLIIAEAGVNHNGDIQIAKQLIDAAKHAGADVVKFQSFRAENLTSQKAKKADYQRKALGDDDSQLTMIQKLEFSENEFVELYEYCQSAGIQFMSSPFDEQAADYLHKIGIGTFKIPSGEITNLPFLEHVAGLQKPIILSTGMCNLGEIEEALTTIYARGNKNVTLLHCVTEYPTPYEQTNLYAMQTLKHAFGLPVGYSDHTQGIEVPIAAAALGAVVIEKHFTLDRNMEGPDHKASLEPAALQHMIKSIRNVVAALGDGIKKPAECERKNIEIARKSVVASCDIAKGTKFMPEMLGRKRPGYGIPPKNMMSLLGRTSKADICKDDVITWDLVE